MISDLGQATWIKTTRSQQTTDQCVELAAISGYAAVRDSKDPEGPKLIFEATTWHRFRNQLKFGEYDRI